MTLPEIRLRDYRAGGLPAYARDHAEDARHLMQTVIAGLGPVGRLGRAFLPGADRLAMRWLETAQDPYRGEIQALRRLLDRPGTVAFSLSYEFGCTARVFSPDSDQTVLFRTLDWPFRGLGALVEIVRLAGPAGDWVTATWPGVVGVLHGAAPGRFVAALNQAPERASRFGRAASWIAEKRRFLRSTGLPPAHLLRQVFETAGDFAAARRLLSETPVAVPVIFTLAGPAPGEVAVIERLEAESAEAREAVAANHFASAIGAGGRWRARGVDSAGRRQAALALDRVPDLTALAPPILNPLTRLALTLSTGGGLTVAGFEGARRVTRPGTA